MNAPTRPVLRWHGLYKINGFVVVLAHVRNVYPLEKSDAGWEWGFKFTDGFYETFVFKKKADTRSSRNGLLTAIAEFYTPLRAGGG